MFAKHVIELNKRILEEGLVVLTWGNASVIDRANSEVYIKPSGIDVHSMTEDDVSVVDIKGNLLRGKKPSVDTPTHLELYKNFNTNCIIHTHSLYGTVFAQARSAIPCLGTTHADYFYGDIPCVDLLPPDSIKKNYEKNIGTGIINFFNTNKIAPLRIPACLIPCHGVIVWGPSPVQTFENAVVLEFVAKMAHKQIQLPQYTPPGRSVKMAEYYPGGEMPGHLLNKHFLRKHGKYKYYGQ